METVEQSAVSMQGFEEWACNKHSVWSYCGSDAMTMATDLRDVTIRAGRSLVRGGVRKKDGSVQGFEGKLDELGVS